MAIWDTTGNKRFRNITTQYYKGADGIVLMNDITDKSTLEDLYFYINSIENTSKDICKILVGNKCDAEDIREVSFEEGQEFAKKNGITNFIETSAKKNLNINEVFEILTTNILNPIINLKYKKGINFYINEIIKENKNQTLIKFLNY